VTVRVRINTSPLGPYAAVDGFNVTLPIDPARGKHGSDWTNPHVAAMTAKEIAAMVERAVLFALGRAAGIAEEAGE
jgi:hypothetical protein